VKANIESARTLLKPYEDPKVVPSFSITRNCGARFPSCANSCGHLALGHRDGQPMNGIEAPGCVEQPQASSAVFGGSADPLWVLSGNFGRECVAGPEIPSSREADPSQTRIRHPTQLALPSPLSGFNTKLLAVTRGAMPFMEGQEDITLCTAHSPIPPQRGSHAQCDKDQPLLSPSLPLTRLNDDALPSTRQSRSLR